MESRKHSGTVSGASAAKNDFSISTILIGALTGLAVMAVSAIILLVIGCGIAYSNEDPAIFEMPLALASLYISIFLGGLTAGKNAGSSKLLSGIIFTAAAFALMLLLKILMGGKESLNGSAYYLLGAFAFSMAGAVVSVFLKQKKQPRKKNQRKIRRKK